MTDTTLPDAAMADLPPSAKLVAKALAYHGTMTQSELSEETWLPDRTTRYALRRLKDCDLVETEPNPTDPRQTRYTISPPPTPEAANTE